MKPQEIVERALAVSSADGCIVIADETSTANLRWANNVLTTNGDTRRRTLTVVAIIEGATGTAAGVASENGITGKTIEPLVRCAEEAARAGVANEDAEPLLAARELHRDWEDPPAETCMGVFAEIIPALSEAFARARNEGRRLFGYAQHTAQCTYIATTSGLRLRHQQPSGYVELTTKSPDFSNSTWIGAATRDFTDVDIASMDRQLARRTAWMKRKIDLPPGRYETILPPSAVADLMIPLYFAAGARDARDGRSVFSKRGGASRVGDVLCDAPLTLRSNPSEYGMECSPFAIARSSGNGLSVFDNGAPLAATKWIDNGKLSTLVESRHSAAVSASPATLQIENLILECAHSTASLAEMVEKTKRGILLTCLWYVRDVDPRELLLTGMTRDGVYMVEDGRITGAVNNFRFNESPVGLFSRASEVGKTERTLAREWGGLFPQTAMPPMRIEDFNMSSVSDSF